MPPDNSSVDTPSVVRRDELPETENVDDVPFPDTPVHNADDRSHHRRRCHLIWKQKCVLNFQNSNQIQYFSHLQVSVV